MQIVRKRSLSTFILYIFSIVVAVGTLLVLSACSTVRVADYYQTIDLDTSSVAKTVSECYREITGRRMGNFKSISTDTYDKLEDCVNERVESQKHIELVFVGGKQGFMPILVTRNWSTFWQELNDDIDQARYRGGLFCEEIDPHTEYYELIQSIKKLKANSQLSDEEKLARALEEIDEYVKESELYGK